MKSPHEHNQDMQRQLEKRMREIDDQINSLDPPFYETQKLQVEQSQKSGLRKVILGAKLFGLAVATIFAVKLISALAGIVIFGALSFLIYKLFLESQVKNIK